jgi:DNA invertase Pin-like site-specific DNA recombinase
MFILVSPFTYSAFDLEFCGRPTVMDADKLVAAKARKAKGESVTAIAKALGVSRATLYRVLADTE